jgi:uracil phosphoribosyltransferase
MPAHVLDHPVAASRLTELRSVLTGQERFRDLVAELTTMLVYEAARGLATEPVDVETPLGIADGRRLATPGPLVVPILRAGLGMLDATIRMVPSATVALLGMRRDHDTLQSAIYADTLPPRLDGRVVFVVDPMLATGGSAALACRHVLDRGAAEVHVICLVGAPEGLARLEAEAPDATVWVAAVDPKLDANGYIHPGLGDAGDRLYGLLGP